MESEQWKTLDEYPGYEVSNMGRIKNNTTGKYSLGNDDYYIKDLSGKYKSRGISRLVALAFVPNPDPHRNKCVGHYDRDKNNNRADNLFWATQNDLMMAARNDLIKATCNESATVAPITYSNNSSGFRGVSYAKIPNVYKAYLCINGKNKQVGVAKTAEEASEMYKTAVRQYYPHLFKD